jgi:hypothetical protein
MCVVSDLIKKVLALSLAVHCFQAQWHCDAAGAPDIEIAALAMARLRQPARALCSLLTGRAAADQRNAAQNSSATRVPIWEAVFPPAYTT